MELNVKKIIKLQDLEIVEQLLPNTVFGDDYKAISNVMKLFDEIRKNW